MVFALVVHHDDDYFDCGVDLPPVIPTPEPAPTSDSHMPLFTATVGDVILTVIRVDTTTISYQTYAAHCGTWDLIGIHDLYVDALANVGVWRDYLTTGRTLAQWRVANPYGVQRNAMLQLA